MDQRRERSSWHVYPAADRSESGPPRLCWPRCSQSPTCVLLPPATPRRPPAGVDRPRNASNDDLDGSEEGSTVITHYGRGHVRTDEGRTWTDLMDEDSHGVEGDGNQGTSNLTRWCPARAETIVLECCGTPRPGQRVALNISWTSPDRAGSDFARGPARRAWSPRLEATSARQRQAVLDTAQCRTGCRRDALPSCRRDQPIDRTSADGLRPAG